MRSYTDWPSPHTGGGAHGSKHLFFLLLLALPVVLLAGLWQRQQCDRELREELVYKLHTVHSLLPQVLPQAPSFQPADTSSREYQNLNEFFATCSAIVSCRGIYLMQMDAEGVRFGPESYRRQDPQASQLGELYHQPPQELLSLFNRDAQITVGPYTDEYGTFVSAFSSYATQDGQRLVVGMDMEATRWQGMLRDALVTGLSLVLLPVLLLLMGGLLLSWRELLRPPYPFFLRWIEGWLVPLLGIILTATCVYFVHQHEKRESYTHFQQLAESQSVGGLVRRLGIQEQNLQHLGRLLEFGQENNGSSFIMQTLEYLTEDSLRTYLRDLALQTGSTAQLSPWRLSDERYPRRILSDLRKDGVSGACCLRLYLPLAADADSFRQLSASLDLESELASIQHRGKIQIPIARELLLVRANGEESVLASTGKTSELETWYTWPVYVFGQVLALRVYDTRIPGGYFSGLSLLVGILGLLLSFSATVLVIHALLRRQEREALFSEMQSRESRYRCLVENANDAIVVVKDKKVVFANSRLGQILGQDPTALLGRSYTDLVAPEFRELASKTREELLAGKTIEQRLQVKTISGNWIQPSLSFIHWEGEEALMIIAADIDAWVESERARREFEVLMHTALEQSPIGMVVVDPDFHIRMANISVSESFRELHPQTEGVRLEELASLWIMRDKSGQELALEETPLVRSVREGFVIQNQEIHIEAETGDKRIVLGSAAPIHDEQGNIIAGMGLFQDITELRRYEENAHASERLENMGNLAGGVAHDLNNLLTPIIGYCEVLSLELRQEDQLNSLRHIRQSADLAHKLVKQLLAFGRQQELELQPVSLNELILDVLELLRRGLTGSTSLDMQLGDRLPQVQADPNQIKQVLLNLVLNARDAMPDGGQLTLSTQVYHTSDDADEEERWVSLEVRDTGHGMSEETMARIFEPLYTTKTDGKGTGLGLAMVHGIVHQHGGKVEVQSELNVGSRFRILLPPVR